MSTVESLIGWVIILAAVYIIYLHTQVTTKVKSAAGSGTVAIKKRMNKRRALDIGGFSLGLAVGPTVLEMLLALLGGFTGGIAFNGLGMSNLGVLAAGGVAVAAFFILTMRNTEG